MLACFAQRTHGLIEHIGARTPLGHGLGVDAESFGQGPMGTDHSLELCADTRRCASVSMLVDLMVVLLFQVEECTMVS